MNRLTTIFLMAILVCMVGCKKGSAPADDGKPKSSGVVTAKPKSSSVVTAKPTDTIVIFNKAFLKDNPTWKSRTVLKLKKGEPVTVLNGTPRGTDGSSNYWKGYGFMKNRWKHVKVRGTAGWVPVGFIASPAERPIIATATQFIKETYSKKVDEKGFKFSNFVFASIECGAGSCNVEFTKAWNYVGGEISEITCTVEEGKPTSCAGVY